MKKKDSSDFPEEKKDDLVSNIAPQVKSPRTKQLVEKMYGGGYQIPDTESMAEPSPTESSWLDRVIWTVYKRYKAEEAYRVDPKRYEGLTGPKRKNSKKKTLYEYDDLQFEGLLFPTTFLQAFAKDVSVNSTVKLTQVWGILEHWLNPHSAFIKIQKDKKEPKPKVKNKDDLNDAQKQGNYRISITKLGIMYIAETNKQRDPEHVMSEYWNYQDRTCPAKPEDFLERFESDEE